MQTNALQSGGAASVGVVRRRGMLVLICVLAVALEMIIQIYARGGSLLTSLGDTDDATRLFEVHTFLSHGGWWDMTLDRIGAPEPLVSHWSRLVDLGLAGVLVAAGSVLSPEHAELVMRVVWPSLLLLLLLLIVARDAEYDGGVMAAWAVAGLLMMSWTALYQFRPGRVDHHNVQILCGVGGVLLLARSMLRPASGWWAGFLIGLGLVVGLEAATMLGPTLVVAVLMGLGRPRGLEGPMRAVVGMAGALVAGVFSTIPPARLGVMVCDAAALNLVALVAFGALGVVGAGLAARWTRGRRLVAVQLASLAAGGLAGLVVYGLMEPRCLAGPFGQVPAGVWKVWLSKVTETQPITFLYTVSARDTLGYVLLVLVGIGARLWLALQDRAAHGEMETLQRHMLLLAIQILAFAASCWQVKMMPYAAWLALPALAVAAVSLPGVGSVQPAIVRLTAFMLFLQSTLGAFAGTAVAMIAKPAPANSQSFETACSETQTISTLAALPPGLVLADINLGPYIVALTPHRVVMGPYHRLGNSIVEGTELLAGKPDAAEARLRQLGVDYVVACRAPEPATLMGKERAAKTEPTLERAVEEGKAPAYLAPVAVKLAPTLSVYRVLPPKG